MDTPLTRGDLCQATGAKFFLIDYLRSLGRLPVIRKSEGRGVPTLFHPDSIKIVRKYLDNRRALLARFKSRH